MASNANYARMDIRYVLPDGSEETETMSGSEKGAIASAAKAALARGNGTKVYITAHIPAGGRHRLPAHTNVVYKGEVKDGRLYERGGSFSRPGAKAKFAIVDKHTRMIVMNEYGGGYVALLWDDRLKREIRAVKRFDSKSEAQKFADDWNKHKSSRPGAKAKFAVEDRFYFGK